ncbi:E3 ubiquitin-protein ligase RNF114 isoform X2 [Clupea harengus]|nr:E3 ubiquitin-protein ligase RNF114 isoform X2 [Clupea harengus]
MIPPFNGRSVFADIWNRNSQLIAFPNQSGSPNPNFALPPAPLILPAAPAPVLRSPRPLFWTSTTAQTSDPVGLRHSRPFRNSNIPWLTMYSHSDFSMLHVQNLLIEQAQAEQRGPMLNNSVRVFVCPYCQLGGMDELDLRDHCNAHHRYDPTPVVCPVCVSLPHGDENYYSQNFIAHLNVRHSYYSQDITAIHQSDDMNMQVAMLESLITSH